jgi:hypothetical protein
MEKDCSVVGSANEEHAQHIELQAPKCMHKVLSQKEAPNLRTTRQLEKPGNITNSQRPITPTINHNASFLYKKLARTAREEQSTNNRQPITNDQSQCKLCKSKACAHSQTRTINQQQPTTNHTNDQSQCKLFI